MTARAARRAHFQCADDEEDEGLGVIGLYRTERPFDAREIALVETRQPGGDRDRECASAQRVAHPHHRADQVAGAADGDAEVLRVISNTGLGPVFDLIVRA